MEDRQIVELFWQRSEKALECCRRRYAAYCMAVARRILDSREDAEECLNDVWLRVWNAIPPARPQRLKIFLGKITRNLALDRYRRISAQKRGGGQLPAVLEELESCVPAALPAVEDQLALKDALERFLLGLPPEERCVFLQRYWYVCSVQEIAAEHRCGESRIKMMLLRTRAKLKNHLEKEEIGV